MGGYKNEIDETLITTALHAHAHSLNPPTDLKQRIDTQLAWQEKKEVLTMKKFNAKKIVAAAALACALTGTVCMAAEKLHSYYISSSAPDTEVTNFSDVTALEKQADIVTGAPKAFENGFAFQSAHTVDTDYIDEESNVKNSFKEISLRYANDAKSLSLSVIKSTSVNRSEEELSDKQAIEADGITYYYTQDKYLFLPSEDYELTKEEKEAEAAGELFISYGSSEREENLYQGISWDADGYHYNLFGMDAEMDVEELLEMAKQIG